MRNHWLKKRLNQLVVPTRIVKLLEELTVGGSARAQYLTGEDRSEVVVFGMLPNHNVPAGSYLIAVEVGGIVAV
jgi:hypothetical protein